VAGSDPEQGISWYDVLGVLAGASAETIQRTYEEKMSLLRPPLTVQVWHPPVRSPGCSR
jgi:hypothetical protein